MARRPFGGLSRKNQRSRGMVLLVFLVLSCLALLASALNFQRQLEEVRSADTDNQGWIVAQLEVDHQNMILAAQAALLAGAETPEGFDPASFREAQTEFDIFYSRVSVFMAAIRNLGTIPPTLESHLSRLAEARADLAKRIDAITVGDTDALEDFARAAAGHAQLVRTASTAALQQFVIRAQTAREGERAIWKQFLLQSLVLLSLTAISALLAIRMWRDLQDRTMQAERAASTITKAYESSLSAVIVTDLEGKILLCNHAAERIFGFPMAELCGERVDDRMLPSRMQPLVRRRMRAVKEGKGRRHIVAEPHRSQALRRGGEVFPIELSVTSDTDLNGQPILIAFVRDISAEVAAEDALRAAVAEAQRAAAAKSMFLATMSHEMRTPLHGLIASLDLMNAESLSEDDRRLLKTARDCSQRALSQVNDVLHLTRLSESREARTAFRPVRIARDVIEELRPIARENGNHMDLVISGTGADVRIAGMASAFSRVLYNLAGNAVKFTRSGRIEVRLEFTPVEGARLHLKVTVTDTGPGIDPADHERVFQLFETTQAAEGGTGLGLPIARLAVEAMGGQLHLDSRRGAGSRFWFDVTFDLAMELPEPDPAQTVTALPAPGRFPSRDVLIVDDNEVNLSVMKRMVERLGHRTALARNGSEAVDLAAQVRYDVILMDVSMPVMDGRTATRLIRQEGLSRDAFIMGVTALIEAEDPAMLAGSGMDAVASKPIAQAQLAARFVEIEEALEDAEGLADEIVDDSRDIPTLADAIPGLVRRPQSKDTDTDRGKSETFARSHGGARHAPTCEDPANQDDADQGLTVDIAFLADLVGAETAPRLVKATLEDVRDALAAMRDGRQDRGAAAHRAAGSTAVVGLARLSEALRRLERATDGSGDVDACVTQVERLLELADPALQTHGG